LVDLMDAVFKSEVGFAPSLRRCKTPIRATSPPIRARRNIFHRKLKISSSRSWPLILGKMRGTTVFTKIQKGSPSEKDEEPVVPPLLAEKQLTFVSGNDETWSPKPTAELVRFGSSEVHSSIAHTGSHQPPALLSVTDRLLLFVIA